MTRRGPLGWPVEAVAEWHERVGLILRDVRRPTRSQIREAELLAQRWIVDSGRLEELRQMAREAR